ncbi:MAG TPA: hypothetical protein VKG44_01120, partial [Candidatus Baltobacteraceae bacterium]|nr:hypothetical protein [Candidatus Baltobacteraceae bacterium]
MRLITRSLRRSSHLAVLAVGAGALAFGLIGPALATTQTGQLTVIDSTSGDFWALAGVNTNVGSVSLVGAGFSDNQVGTAGYVTGANAVAVEGYSASTGPTAYGVYGLSQTGNGIYGVNTNGAVASIYGYNTATGGTAMYGYSTGGNAVLGTSTKTNGVVGITQSPGSISTYYAGVLGMDTSSASSNYGLAGTSANGTAIYGNSQVGYGVLGVESSTSGGASAAGIGGFSNQGAGGQFESAHNAGLIAQSVLALADLSLPSGEAGLFTGSSGTAADPVVVVLSDVAGTDYFATYNNSVGGTPQTFIIQAGSANYSGKAPANSSDVQVSGDLYVQGQVYSLCSSSGGAFPVTSPHSHCVYSNSTSPAVRIRSGTGADVTAYEPHQSVPTMEDFGEA